MLRFNITLLILIISRLYLHCTGKPRFKKLIFYQIIFDERFILKKKTEARKKSLMQVNLKIEIFLISRFHCTSCLYQLTNSCCNHHIDGTSQSDSIYWKMKPRKRMKQKVWIICVKCQPKALHNGKYDVEGVKYINTCKNK